MRLASCVLAAIIVAGCSEPPPEKTVFDTQVRALKKAREVQGQLQQAAEHRRDAENAEQPAAGKE